MSAVKMVLNLIMLLMYLNDTIWSSAVYKQVPYLKRSAFCFSFFDVVTPFPWVNCLNILFYLLIIFSSIECYTASKSESLCSQR